MGAFVVHAIIGAQPAGIPRVKMKIGREPERVGVAREAIDEQAQLFVDANGAYLRKQALEFAWAFSDLDVSWFEEPVSSDDLEGLRLIRDDGPPGMDIAAGEYGYAGNRALNAGLVLVVPVDTRACLVLVLA